MSRIFLSPPHVGPEERQLLLSAFDSNWIAPLGPEVDGFEADFQTLTGQAGAAALSSGTAALHLALILLGIGSGDLVLVSDLTFIASVNPVRYVGAEPALVDCDDATWTVHPDRVAQALEDLAKRGRLPKALIAVDLYGQCADYERLSDACKRYDIPIVQDAAEALGATYQGRPAGSQGALAAFSFNGNKIITTSGGGMLVSNRRDWIARARKLASQAREPAPHYEHQEMGFNYRMSNLLAAVGRAQLHSLGEKVVRRRDIFDAYRRGLAELPGWNFMPEATYGRSNRWLTCATIDPEVGYTPEDVRLALERQDIEARPLWKPMHLQPLYRGCTSFGGLVGERLFEQGICLPSGSSLKEAEQEQVMEVIRDVARERGAL